ncbi:MAG: hypothetical protein GY928_40570 [Colwellia sp.]|nr:hypothetical protein [Colwellia sp.]MCP4992123.1 hypothetical protein [Colwellia sp.]
MNYDKVIESLDKQVKDFSDDLMRYNVEDQIYIQTGSAVLVLSAISQALKAGNQQEE